MTTIMSTQKISIQSIASSTSLWKNVNTCKATSSRREQISASPSCRGARDSSRTQRSFAQRLNATEQVRDASRLDANRLIPGHLLASNYCGDSPCKLLIHRLRWFYLWHSDGPHKQSTRLHSSNSKLKTKVKSNVLEPARSISIWLSVMDIERDRPWISKLSLWRMFLIRVWKGDVF